MDITRTVVSERKLPQDSSDYEAYRKQGVRRIHALRRRLGTATPKGRKYTSKAPVTAENVASNVEWVQLLLASAERAWASAEAMCEAQRLEKIQKPMPASTKKQIVSHLIRAIRFAENLVSVLEDNTATKASATDLLEAKAYLAMLRGRKDVQKSRWESCLQNYAIVSTVYTTLGNAANTDLYKELLSDVETRIRYAALQLKVPRTKPLAEVVVEKFPKREGKAKKSLIEIDPQAFEINKEVSQSAHGVKDIPTHITWRSRKVKLEDSTISQALAIANEKEKNLRESFSDFQKDKIDASQLAAAYDDVITIRQDAADATKTAIDELTAEGVDSSDQRIQSLQITRTAVNYAVIEYRIGRSRVLCGAQDGLKFEPAPRKRSTKVGKDGQPRTAKAESSGRRTSRLRERVALYDLILQSLKSIEELPGVIADTSLMAELDGKRSYFRALKCLAIGRSHAINSNATNALALYNRGLSLAQTASSTLPSSTSSDAPTTPKLDLTATTLTTATTYLISLVTQYRALATLKTLTTPPSTSTPAPKQTRPLIETLHQNTYHENLDLTNLVNYPPKLQPIPVKPLFFDLAWNYIQYPGHEKRPVVTNGAKEEARTASPAPVPQEGAKRRWFGLVGGS